MKKWQGIVIHHTASHDVPAETIRKWHTASPFNFSDIGYHFVVRANGKIEPGRSLERIGAHARRPSPSRNRTYIGIALTGCFSGAAPNSKCILFPTMEQLRSLIMVIKALMHLYHIPRHKIESHHKSCPGERFPIGLIVQELEEQWL